jgi:hypothetical protein
LGAKRNNGNLAADMASILRRNTMQGNIAGAQVGGQISGYSEAQRKEDNERNMRITALQMANNTWTKESDQVLADAQKYYDFMRGLVKVDIGPVGE